jgi:hypothetical protein
LRLLQTLRRKYINDCSFYPIGGIAPFEKILHLAALRQLIFY